MNITALKDFSIIVGGLVTIVAFANGLLEYRRQGAQKRVEHFTMLRRRLKENPVFKEICALMFANDPRLAEIDASLLGLGSTMTTSTSMLCKMANHGIVRKFEGAFHHPSPNGSTILREEEPSCPSVPLNGAMTP